MDKALVYGFVMVLSAYAASVASYTGRLIDAGCAEQQPNASCNPTPATRRFALISAGKILTFDSMGNAKATAALKQRNSKANREQLSNAADGVNAMIQGEVMGYQIAVRDIEVQ